jgi:hypothetical protein
MEEMPMSDAAKFDDTPDFSLILGGPLYQLFLRLRMAKPPLDLLTRRMIIMPLIAWLPLLLMSTLGGQVVAGIMVPFLSDLSPCPLSLGAPTPNAAEVIVHRTCGQSSGSTPPAHRAARRPAEIPRVRGVAMRLRNSILAEVHQRCCLYRRPSVVEAAAGAAHRNLVRQRGGWRPAALTRRVLVRLRQYPDLPIHLPALVFRLFIWFRFLWQVSRLDPSHPHPPIQPVASGS